MTYFDITITAITIITIGVSLWAVSQGYGRDSHDDYYGGGES